MPFCGEGERVQGQIAESGVAMVEVYAQGVAGGEPGSNCTEDGIGMNRNVVDTTTADNKAADVAKGGSKKGAGDSFAVGSSKGRVRGGLWLEMPSCCSAMGGLELPPADIHVYWGAVHPRR